MNFETIRDEVFSFESADVAGGFKDLKLKISPEETESRRNKNQIQLYDN